jgi:hypothetical protein
MNECYTCGKVGLWRTELQSGHFIRRTHKVVMFDPRNVHPQCIRCNKWLHGNEAEYGHRIRKRLGDAVYDDLFRLKHEYPVFKFDRTWLEQQIEKYKKLTEGL